MGWPVTLPAEQRPEVVHSAIQRYLDGERMEDIAGSHGLSLKRMYAILTLEAEEQWKAAQVGAAIERLEKAKSLMDNASSMQDIAQARESAKLAQWDLERVCRRIYGTDAPPQAGQGVVAISINFSADKPSQGVTISQDGSAATD